MRFVNAYCWIIFFYLMFFNVRSQPGKKEEVQNVTNELGTMKVSFLEKVEDVGGKFKVSEQTFNKRQAAPKTIQIVPQQQPGGQFTGQRSPIFPSQLTVPQNLNVGNGNVFVLPGQFYPGAGNNRWVPTTNGVQPVLQPRQDGSGPDNVGRTPRQQNGNVPIASQNPNIRSSFAINPNQFPPGMAPNMIPNPNRPFQPDQSSPSSGPNIAPSPIRPEVITVPLTNVPKGQTQGPNRPQPRPPINRPSPNTANTQNPGNPVDNQNQPQGPILIQGLQQGPNSQGQQTSSFQPLIITPVNVSRPRVIIPPQVPGGLAPIQTPNGRLMLEPYPENFCDLRQFPDEQLAARSLQRVEYFVANLSCSRYFFECAVGQTFLLNCTSKDQVYDTNTVNCNFRRNVRSCPEYDHILHCTIKEQCQIDQFACCATPQSCIPYARRCDGVPDCQDGDDENNCPACEPDEFPCVKSGRCIKLAQRCNGVPDECFDQTNLDEIHCQGCGSNKFYCSRSETCIDQSARCNGVRECPRGEDELNCKMKGPKYLLCENQKQSVAKEQWCDGYEDCVDGTDEKYCIY